MPINLSPELQTLLDDKLDTFEKLELVLTLHSTGAPMTLADMALHLQVGREALRRVVDEVAASQVIEANGDDTFRLRSGYWDGVMDEAASILANEPTMLMRVFTRIALARIRGMAARTFAEAFRIRKKGD
ncbi:MAG: hypothetical protein H0T89_17160 [Deltaproteobacteria bacterium]|nr:hypothetical protein [Deltaproteobacteria bacterium]MDQ3294965.1 hypothetical protein [Myxococcota bacterium]